jgi:glycosyltransferase involved in cell wall biosynthesis
VIKVLLVGPLPPPTGGDTRHFVTLVRDLTAHPGFEAKVIDTSRGVQHSNWLRNLFVSVRTMVRVAWALKHVDIVSYHASDRGMLLFGPVVVALCRLSGRSSILRVFGGSFGDTYRGQSRLQQWLTRRTVLCCDVLLLQTKRSIRDIQSVASARVIWFSTYIDMPTRAVAADQTRQALQSARCCRFVYLGHLWRTKGLETILDAAGKLPAACSIDVYGPADQYTPAQIDERGLGKVKYRGILSRDQVNEKLWEYDCLVLPTFHPGEGYPGVIAEAFAHDLPVITTNWLAIPEIVDDQSAILIEPQDTSAFVAAVELLHADPVRWRQLKEGARRKAAQFDHAVWSKEFESICGSLVRS